MGWVNEQLEPKALPSPSGRAARKSRYRKARRLECAERRLKSFTMNNMPLQVAFGVL